MITYKTPATVFAILAVGVSTPLMADVDAIDLQLYGQTHNQIYTTQNIHTDTSSLTEKLTRYRTDPEYSQALSLSYRDNDNVDDGIGSFEYLRFIDFILNEDASLYSTRDVQSYKKNSGNENLLNNNMRMVEECRDRMLPDTLPENNEDLDSLFNNIVNCSIGKVDAPYGAVHLDTSPLDNKLQQYENNPLYKKNIQDHQQSLEEYVGDMTGKNYIRLLSAFLDSDLEWDDFKDIKDRSYKYLDEFYLKHQDAYGEIYPDGIPDRKNRLHLNQDNKSMLDNNMQALFNCRADILPDKMPRGFDDLGTLFDEVLSCAKSNIHSAPNKQKM